MLIVLPASEAKNLVDRGMPLDPAALSFPTLTPTRGEVLDALVQASDEPDATRRLGVPATMSELVHRNVRLRDAPAATAGAVYSGVLYDAIGLADLDAASRRRARSWIVVVSALWGAIRLGDRIPSYRLNMCGHLPGLAHLPQVWQQPLAGVLPAAAGRRVVVDFRTADFLTAWRPRGPLAERTIAVKVVRDQRSKRGAASHNAKFTGGLVVRRIVSDAIDSSRPEDVAQALSAHFDVDLVPPARPGSTWTLHVLESHR